MLNEDATLSENAGFYIGEDRFRARKLIVKDLEERGQLVKVEEISNKVGYSERTDAVIEPRLSLQWFLKMKDLGGPALDNVMNDTIRFFPPKFKNSYRHWMENIQDWCISRQLWWGQQIPAWYYGGGHDEYVIAKTADEALEKARTKSGNPGLDASSIKQDEDVLDTWFSSWLWPITVFDGMKDPDNRDINYYYPTTDLVTAPEIMFFWVARMIMAGYAFRGEPPFRNVYYNGIVRDKQRRKMSKSLGNSPEPLELIAQYGADGTRVGMLFAAPAGNDLLFDEALCEQGRNFSNKIWNAFRFVAMNMEDGVEYTPNPQIDDNSLADRWMQSRLQSTIRAMQDDYEKYRLNEALQEIYSLVWDDFCDWYIELCKADIPGEKIPKERLERALGFFEELMKLLHPFMPFITEEIWQRIRSRTPEQALVITAEPGFRPEQVSDGDTALFATLQQLVSAARNIRAEMNIGPNVPLTMLIRSSSEVEAAHLMANDWILKKLQQIETLQIGPQITKPGFAATAIVGSMELIIPLEGLIDLDKERERITKEITRLEGFLKAIDGKLSNERFVQNAPAEVVENERKKRADSIANLEKLRGSLRELG
jgi:valyl-tRNA synthetase